MLALGGVFYFITGVIIPVLSAAWGILTFIGGAFTGAFALPILAALATIWLAWVFLSEYIQGFWDSMVSWATPGLDFLTEAISIFAADVSTYFIDMVDTIKAVFSFIAPLIVPIFEHVGRIVGGAFTVIAGAIGVVIFVLGKLLKMIGVVVRLGFGLFLNTLQLIVQQLVRFADAVGAGGIVPKNLRAFANQPEFQLFSPEIPDMGDDADRKELAKAATDQVAIQKKQAAAKPEVTVEVQPTPPPCVEVSNEVHLDGRKVSKNQAKHKQEINERAGFKAQPWQRRVALEQGAVPTGGRG
jgi:hypothetical protein